MLLSPADLDPTQPLTADVCIVGAGAAGISIARSLANTSLRVLLLEGGGEQPSERSQELYRGEMATVYRKGKWGKEDRNYLMRSRLRYFGGTTNHWNGWCRPLEPVEFSERAWVPHGGWPISRDDLAPWYRKATDVVQIPPFDPEEGYGRPRGRRMVCLADSPDIITRLFHWSPPTRFGSQYRQELVDAPNVRVLLEANALRAHATPERQHVTHLDVQLEDGPRLTVRASRFVFACGGIENARLMLLSELGSDAVGRYFMDHPHLRYAGQIVVGDELGVKGLTDLYFAARREGGQPTRTLGVFGTSAAFQATHRTLGFSAQLRSRRKEELNAVGEAVVAAQTVVRDLGRPKPQTWTPYSGLVMARGEQAPNPDSRVTLGDDTDRLGLRRVRLDWQVTEADARSLRTSMEALAHELGRVGIGRLRIRLKRDGLPELRGGDHHIGTTRMSAGPTNGVVDANCRVHGIDNLWIAGSSVFSTSGFANPTLTITALALRLADHLRREAP